MNTYVATIGMFDGVHRGHRFVLERVAECARERGMKSMAITFDHSPHHKQTLTTAADKRIEISKAGIDRVEVLPFTDELRQLTAREFMERVLRDQLGVSVLLTGYDNRFGRDRRETFEDYVTYGRELGIDVLQLPPMPVDKGRQPVSSSLIRSLLANGRVEDAANCLGRPYALTGRVVRGNHVGTTLGFPTANIEPDDNTQLVPAAGVYAVTVRRSDSMTEQHAMMNIGSRPTFDGSRQTLEVNIFQLNENLYGERLRVSFVGRLRDEHHFPSADELRSQLAADAEHARQLMGNGSVEDIVSEK